MIYISCQFETPIHRSDYSDYVRALQLDILGWDGNGNRFLLGKIAAEQVLISGAQNDGMPLFDVCDQDSQGLYEAWEALFDHKCEFQPELEIDEPADSLIFIWQAVLHPRLRPYGCPVPAVAAAPSPVELPSSFLLARTVLEYNI